MIEGLDIITQYVLSITPAATAILGLILTLVVGIKKIKSVGESCVKETKEINKENREVRQQMANLEKENAELKKDLRIVLKRMNGIYVKEDEVK